MNRRLDYNSEKAEVLQLSNDAYFCLVCGEPCLDDANYEEVQEFKARFKYGYMFDKQYGIDFVEDSDMIECKVIPICESSTPFTHYRIDGKWFKHEFYYSPDRKQVNYRIYDLYHGHFIEYGWNDVIINQYNQPEIRPNKCIFPIWGKNWLRY